MGTEKERIRRWRERARTEGKKSVTIVISGEVHDYLSIQKNKTGESYGAIIEKALLTMKKQRPVAIAMTSNIPSNRTAPPVTLQAKKLIIDDDDYSPRRESGTARDSGFIYAGDEPLSQGFLPRLFKTSKRKFFKK